MKRLILAAIFCMLATSTFAQNNGLGFRVGSGAELQYERYFNSGSVLKLNAGLYDYAGNYFGTVIYDWDCFTWENWTPKAGDWFFNAGLGASFGTWKSDFNVGFLGEVSFGIHFKGAPISLSVDYRPVFFLLNNCWNDSFGSAGLSCIFRF